MIKLVLTDCDGCLTNGRVTIDSNGVCSKTFNMKDGVGFIDLQKRGIKTGIISCDSAKEILNSKYKKLNLDYIIQGIDPNGKLDVVKKIIRDNDIKWSEVVYLGDDLPDLEILTLAGNSFCPIDAVEEVKAVCEVLQVCGGDGAFREMVNIILKNDKGT